MFRRDWIKTMGLATSALAGAVHLGAAAQSKYQEGMDYVALDTPAPSDSTGRRVEVIEFFWYSCPHCNVFEPRLEQWIAKLPKDVVLRRVPVAFRDDFVPQQRLYYVLEAMGKLPALHKKVFYAIHVEKQSLNTQESMGKWLAEQGVDREKFNALYNSFAIQSKVAAATKLQNVYKVGGVPALGIGGRYYVDGSLAQSMERALQITDWLIATIKAGR